MSKRTRNKRLPAGIGIVWVVICFIALGFTLFLTITDARIYRTLTDTGITQKATVIDVYTDDDENITYHIRYQFQIRQNKGEITNYGNEQYVSWELFSQTAIGDTIDIVYAADDPTLSRTAGTIKQPTWSQPAIMTVLLLIGVIFIVGRITKEYMRSSMLPKVSDTNYGISQSSLALESLHCERCGLPLGPDMLNCMHRASEACAYTLEQGKLPYSGCLGPFLIIFGLFFAGMPGGFTLSSLFSGDFEIFDLIGFLFTLPFIAAGLALVAVGIYAILGTHTTLHNEKTGQRWQSSTFLGRQIYDVRATSLQDVTLSSAGSGSSSCPVSCAGLVNGENATGIIYNTVLSLMARNVITMQQQYTQTRLFFKRKPMSKWQFVFTPAKQSYIQDGALERKLVEAARDPGASVELIPEQFRFLIGATPVLHGASISGLIRDAANNTEHNDPDRWFRLELVAPDAESRGLGTIQKARLRKRFDAAPGVEITVDSVNRQMEQLRADFQRRYPEAAQDLWDAIESALKTLEPSSD